MEKESSETFEPVRTVAAQVGVPAAWLRRECAADRLPHLLAGRRILVNRIAIEQALAKRAARADGGSNAC